MYQSFRDNYTICNIIAYSKTGSYGFRLDLMVTPCFITEVLSQCHWFAKFPFMFAKLNLRSTTARSGSSTVWVRQVKINSSPAQNSPNCLPSCLHPKSYNLGPRSWVTWLKVKSNEKLAGAKIHSTDVPEAEDYREDIYDSALSWWNTYDVRGHFSMRSFTISSFQNVFRRFERVYRCRSLEWRSRHWICCWSFWDDLWWILWSRWSCSISPPRKCCRLSTL